MSARGAGAGRGRANEGGWGAAQRGYTLIEVLIASMLGMFAILGIEVAWWNSTRTVVQASSQLDLQRDAAFVLESVSDAARGASTFTIQDYGSGSNNLLILKNGAGSELYRFYWKTTDNKLYASKNGGTASVFVASTVHDLDFDSSSGKITTDLELRDGYGQDAKYTGTVWLRN